MCGGSEGGAFEFLEPLRAGLECDARYWRISSGPRGEKLLQYQRFGSPFGTSVEGVFTAAD
jgi:hypothetical protein